MKILLFCAFRLRDWFWPIGLQSRLFRGVGEEREKWGIIIIISRSSQNTGVDDTQASPLYETQSEGAAALSDDGGLADSAVASQTVRYRRCV